MISHKFRDSLADHSFIGNYGAFRTRLQTYSVSWLIFDLLTKTAMAFEMCM